MALPLAGSRSGFALTNMPAKPTTSPAGSADLDLAQIQSIVELMAANNLTLFQWERDEGSITLKRGHDIDGLTELLGKLPAPAAAPVAYAHAPAPVALAAPAPSAAPAAAAETGPAINSPMVGTFYGSSGPNEKPFISVGDQVDENTTVCIIEAMKVMNEIKAETRGTVVRVLVADGKPVQYGQPLVQLK